MEAKPHHPYLTASPPVSAQQPHITCHYRAFRVRELPEDYPYHLEPSSESSTKILVPYYEFRGKGPPPTDIGKLGDLYLDLADVKTYALYVLTRTGWTMWDPLPTQSSAVPPVPELIAHPQSTKLNRYLWCDGYQPSWYSLTTLGRMRSRMRQAGMYHAKGGLSEEYYSSTVAAETIRRMLEAEDTISPQMGVMKQIRKRPSSPLKDSESTHQRKKAKLSTHDTTSINSISEANVSTDRPLSWKIKLTPCYSAATPLPAEHSSGSVIQDVPNGITRALPSGVDAQDVEGDEEDQRVKALIEEKSLYEEENQRLKERVLQLTAQTDRLRDVISKTTICMDAIKSRDIQRNSLSRSVSPEPEMLKNSIIISSTDILKTAGVELKNARLETQKVRLELESIQLEANLQHNRNKACFTNALAIKDKEIEILRGQFNDQVSQVELNFLAAKKRWEQEKAARVLAEKKLSDLVTRVKQFKDTVLS